MAAVIDVHAHAVLGELFGAAGAAGPEAGQDAEGRPWFRVGDYRLHGVDYRGTPFMDPELRLQKMDEAGIDLQVLSPNPITYFYTLDPDAGVDYCRRHNDILAGLVEHRSDRLRAFATLPMQDIPAAIDELERAVGRLGMLGPYIGTEFGTDLDAPEMDDFYRRVVELDVPLFVHPAPTGLGLRPADTRLRRQDLDLLVGMPYEETMATASLVFGGVLHRHPALDVCVSHGGGASAFLHGRLRHAARARRWAPEWLSREGGFDELFQRLWFDCVVHDPGSLDLLLTNAGRGHVVLGTNFAGWDQEPVPDLGELGALMADNARRLLRLGPAPG
ncbi:amidohydrolase family protein [Candidatus Nephthysia bennettiae]|uniref:Amidohydrolase n=1 Tax=Candidatus Nephthysia bennettiae TaxID=3127016 RepID=A0A934K275_9BACT|nr:amidohydrolase [Candidatus Dormibacteraeota bacterium]MBJ7614208.1 amidohydrolase [Candidatus Dormibacteraeota bacterium]